MLQLVLQVRLFRELAMGAFIRTASVRLRVNFALVECFVTLARLLQLSSAQLDNIALKVATRVFTVRTGRMDCQLDWTAKVNVCRVRQASFANTVRFLGTALLDISVRLVSPIRLPLSTKLPLKT
jgi:hypothetical protein